MIRCAKPFRNRRHSPGPPSVGTRRLPSPLGASISYCTTVYQRTPTPQAPPRRFWAKFGLDRSGCRNTSPLGARPARPRRSGLKNFQCHEAEHWKVTMSNPRTPFVRTGHRLIDPRVPTLSNKTASASPCRTSLPNPPCESYRGPIAMVGIRFGSPEPRNQAVRKRASSWPVRASCA
jgi:hypothetical protein